jgi:hypothetical protein
MRRAQEEEYSKEQLQQTDQQCQAVQSYNRAIRVMRHKTLPRVPNSNSSEGAVANSDTMFVPK